MRPSKQKPPPTEREMTKTTELEMTVLSTICAPAEAVYAREDTGSTWTDAKEIARNSNLDLKTVIGTLGSLVKKGLIYVEDEVNGKKVDICCVSEAGCEVLIQSLPKKAEPAKKEPAKKEPAKKEPAKKEPAAAKKEPAKKAAPAANDFAALLKSIDHSAPSAALRGVAALWDPADRKGFMNAARAAFYSGSTAAGAWNAVKKARQSK